MSLEVFTQRILPMKDKLFRFALRLMQDVQEAEDVVQDVMVRLWSKKEEWAQWQNLEGYCMTATRNNCLDRIRKKQPLSVQEERALQVRSNDKDPHEKMMGKETLNSIKECIAALPQNQRLVIQLREIEGFSYNEIAEVLSMSMDQVKVNLFRGRNAIKDSIIKGEVSWNKQR